MKTTVLARGAAAAAIAAAAVPATAADWSDTSIGLRYGNKFAEPFNPNDIKKAIVNLNHVSGYKYGTNFFNADFLVSNYRDPAGAGSTNGAQEVYIVYRHTLDLGKVTGGSYKYGPVRGMGLTAGFDVNAKTDAGYNSKKRMLVAGPTLFMDVPGRVEIFARRRPASRHFGIIAERKGFAQTVHYPTLDYVSGAAARTVSRMVDPDSVLACLLP